MISIKLTCDRCGAQGEFPIGHSKGNINAVVDDSDYQYITDKLLCVKCVAAYWELHNNHAAKIKAFLAERVEDDESGDD